MSLTNSGSSFIKSAGAISELSNGVWKPFQHAASTSINHAANDAKLQRMLSGDFSNPFSKVKQTTESILRAKKDFANRNVHIARMFAKRVQ